MRPSGLLLGAPVLLLHLLVLQLVPHPMPSPPEQPLPAGPDTASRPLQIRLAATPPQPSERPADRPAETPAAATPPSTRPEAPPPRHAAPEAAVAGLDLPPRPVSAPDTTLLEALAAQPLSGLPLRLALDIDASGRLVGLEVLQIEPIDTVALPALQRMFEATRFLPARRDGRDVAARLEIELQLEPVPAAGEDQGSTPGPAAGAASS
ncbi:hypothetical protein ABIC99_000073 [Sphaerotilus sulfidivorans]|uniref:TonB C-terminal domain-containing protein n=1 Tax=Sphaerotilus sulfidivorans TaxID=639200 RepID=A0A5C1Q051_9BURK|nr:hypothetical protein [Sphaerotilus sulfidivorans]NZD44516.1 hypothetical protein [Sphaerotilus sulfidivorans]QEN01305.1 hypothetical protein EWH46_11295 [Sphaerotilus sulfidivorans]